MATVGAKRVLREATIYCGYFSDSSLVQVVMRKRSSFLEAIVLVPSLDLHLSLLPEHV